MSEYNAQQLHPLAVSEAALHELRQRRAAIEDVLDAGGFKTDRLNKLKARHEKQEAAAVQRNLELKQQLHELRSSARGHAHSAQDFIKRAEFDVVKQSYLRAAELEQLQYAKQHMRRQRQLQAHFGDLSVPQVKPSLRERAGQPGVLHKQLRTPTAAPTAASHAAAVARSTWPAAGKLQGGSGAAPSSTHTAGVSGHQQAHASSTAGSYRAKDDSISLPKHSITVLTATDRTAAMSHSVHTSPALAASQPPVHDMQHALPAPPLPLLQATQLMTLTLAQMFAEPAPTLPTNVAALLPSLMSALTAAATAHTAQPTPGQQSSAWEAPSSHVVPTDKPRAPAQPSTVASHASSLLDSQLNKSASARSVVTASAPEGAGAADTPATVPTPAPKPDTTAQLKIDRRQSSAKVSASRGPKQLTPEPVSAASSRGQSLSGTATQQEPLSQEASQTLIPPVNHHAASTGAHTEWPPALQPGATRAAPEDDAISIGSTIARHGTRLSENGAQGQSSSVALPPLPRTSAQGDTTSAGSAPASRHSSLGDTAGPGDAPPRVGGMSVGSTVERGARTDSERLDSDHRSSDTSAHSVDEDERPSIANIPMQHQEAMTAGLLASDGHVKLGATEQVSVPAIRQRYVEESPEHTFDSDVLAPALAQAVKTIQAMAASGLTPSSAGLSMSQASNTSSADPVAVSDTLALLHQDISAVLPRLDGALVVTSDASGALPVGIELAGGVNSDALGASKGDGVQDGLSVGTASPQRRAAQRRPPHPSEGLDDAPPSGPLPVLHAGGAAVSSRPETHTHEPGPVQWDTDLSVTMAAESRRQTLTGTAAQGQQVRAAGPRPQLQPAEDSVAAALEQSALRLQPSLRSVGSDKTAAPPLGSLLVDLDASGSSSGLPGSPTLAGSPSSRSTRSPLSRSQEGKPWEMPGLHDSHGGMDGSAAHAVHTSPTQHTTVVLGTSMMSPTRSRPATGSGGGSAAQPVSSSRLAITSTRSDVAPSTGAIGAVPRSLTTPHTSPQKIVNKVLSHRSEFDSSDSEGEEGGVSDAAVRPAPAQDGSRPEAAPSADALQVRVRALPQMAGVAAVATHTPVAQSPVAPQSSFLGSLIGKAKAWASPSGESRKASGGGEGVGGQARRGSVSSAGSGPHSGVAVPQQPGSGKTSGHSSLAFSGSRDFETDF